MSEIPRGHHYVWQYYLSSWCVDDKVWWNRKGMIQNTKTTKILKKKDMYKIERLNELEKWILDNLWMDDNRKQLKKLINDEMKMFDSLSLFEDKEPSYIIEKLVTDYGMVISRDGIEIDYKVFLSQFEGKENSRENIIEEINKFRIEQGEKLISEDENSGRRFLDMLRKDDISFFDNSNNDIFDFYVFLNSQYFRTVKMRDRISKNVESLVPELKKRLKMDLDADGKKIYSHGLHGFVLKMTIGVLQDKNYKIMMLKSKGMTFITSDQPVMNMDETLMKDGTPESLQYLMPISPDRAIIIGKNIQQNSIVEVDDKTVEYLNGIIKSNSYETIIGVDKKIVTPLI